MTAGFQSSLPVLNIKPFQGHYSAQLRPVIHRRSIAVSTVTMKIDAHVHVWDPAFPSHPNHPLPDSLPGTATDLLACMNNAGIEKTVIVQPINYKFDHTCVLDAIMRHPTRFAGVALADTTLDPTAACDALEKLVNQGFRGVRLNPTFTTSGFRGETVVALVKKAGELDIPVALFARPQHLDDIARLLNEHTETKLVLDHFAFCTPGEHDDAQKKVLDMGRKWKQLYIKTSAWFRVSKEAWPHRDLHLFLNELIANFGAQRLLVGSDYPFVKEQYDYSQAFSLLEDASISVGDRESILGGTAAELYKL